MEGSESLKPTALEALRAIVALLTGGFTGEITMRCGQGGVKDWRVTETHRPGKKS